MTPTSLATLDFVRGYVDRVGYAPTIEEIAARFGIGKGNAHARITNLIRDGKLRRRRYQARGLELADTPDLRMASLAAIRAELARRGETIGALEPDRI